MIKSVLIYISILSFACFILLSSDTSIHKQVSEKNIPVLARIAEGVIKPIIISRIDHYIKKNKVIDNYIESDKSLYATDLQGTTGNIISRCGDFVTISVIKKSGLQEKLSLRLGSNSDKELESALLNIEEGSSVNIDHSISQTSISLLNTIDKDTQIKLLSIKKRESDNNSYKMVSYFRCPGSSRIKCGDNTVIHYKISKISGDIVETGYISGKVGSEDIPDQITDIINGFYYGGKVLAILKNNTSDTLDDEAYFVIELNPERVGQ